MKILEPRKVKKSICYNAPVGLADTKRNGLFENVEMKMERVVAITKLGKMLGKSLGYRIDPKAPTQEERDEANRQLPALTAARQEAEKAMIERRQAVLAADRKYQELVEAWKEAKQNAEKTFSVLRHFKFTVGTSSGMFFHVKAQGDSWEDVIHKLSVKAA